MAEVASSGGDMEKATFPCSHCLLPTSSKSLVFSFFHSAFLYLVIKWEENPKNLAMEQFRETLYCDKERFSSIYQMTKTLGRGTFGTVKLAFHTPTVSYVAVKILENVKGDSARNNNEVDIMRSLIHPHIIRFLQEVQTREMTYVIMDYASKGNLLHQIRKQGGLQECEVRRLFTQVVQAVKYCHDNCIVHRDIKANNILIDASGNAKLCDFGLAVRVVPGKKLKTFCGTLPYCAPELLKVKPYDGYASDVWNLGVLLYYMVARQLPFQASSYKGLKQQILAANFSVPHHVPLDIVNVIMEIFMISPKKRPTISQILRCPMIRDSQARASIQSLPGTRSPSIASTMAGIEYQQEDQKFNQAMATHLSLQHQAPGGDSCHHQVKPTKPMEPGLVLNQADLHLFSGILRKAAEPTSPTFIVPSEPQEKEDGNSRQGGRRHSMPATLCCQPRRIHLAHLSHLRCPVADSLMSSSLDSSKSFSPSKIGLCGSLTASAQPSCSLYHLLGADHNEAANDAEKLCVTPKGSSLGNTLIVEVTNSHGQLQDTGPTSSRNQRRHRWNRLKKTIANVFRHLCCCLPPAESNHASRENQAPQSGDPRGTHRTR
ncbi:sperm motility kinase 2B-like [Microtus oregoni]|uniref:sperm motility kinase 2B-like n=1 Tax=Microtus oregoni TaxID=111838 RepID=UPI001BB15B1B|nr:sperm motility kinase 2B-like [Microtus oregoni]